MNAFDVLARLFVLLLGFAIAEVLGGAARALRLKAGVTDADPAGVRVGWLVPLLAGLVVTSQMSFWLAYYVLQDHIPLTFLTMLVLLLLVGGFYLVSGFVFPAAPERWPDFDAFYFRSRRIVVGGLLAINCAMLAYGVALLLRGVDLSPRTGTPNILGSVGALALLPLLASLLMVRGRRANVVLLVLANAALLAQALSLSR